MSTTVMPVSKAKMEKVIVNPWDWQDNLGFSQAIEVTNSRSTLYVSGQAAMDEDGIPSSEDMSEQISSSLDNLETVLESAGYSLANVVRLNYYTTSINEFFASFDKISERLKAFNCKPTSTLIEVKALAFSKLKIEIEATAVKG